MFSNVFYYFMLGDKNKEVFRVKKMFINFVMCYTNTELECQELERHSKQNGNEDNTNGCRTTGL